MAPSTRNSSSRNIGEGVDYNTKYVDDVIEEIRQTMATIAGQNTTHVCETPTTTQNPDVDNLEEKPVRIIPGPAGIVQAAKLCKQLNIHEDKDGTELCREGITALKANFGTTEVQTNIPITLQESVLSTQEYISKGIEDVGEDEDFKGGSWVSAVEFVNANEGIVNGCLGDIKNYLKNKKLEQVVAIIKFCTPNAFCDLTVTLKDISSIIPVFSPKPSMHYLNITMRNVVKVFHKDTVLCNGSGVCGNVTDQEGQYKLDDEALNLALE
ncbi:hypothetical protein Tco_0392972 [Tanacetum coccineum]